MSKAAESSRWQIAFLLPTAGSFGDIFSYLWQVFFELGLARQRRGNRKFNKRNSDRFACQRNDPKDLGFKRSKRKRKMNFSNLKTARNLSNLF